MKFLSNHFWVSQSSRNFFSKVSPVNRNIFQIMPTGFLHLFWLEITLLILVECEFSGYYYSRGKMIMSSNLIFILNLALTKSISGISTNLWGPRGKNLGRDTNCLSILRVSIIFFTFCKSRQCLTDISKGDWKTGPNLFTHPIVNNPILNRHYLDN